MAQIRDLMRWPNDRLEELDRRISALEERERQAESTPVHSSKQKEELKEELVRLYAPYIQGVFFKDLPREDADEMLVEWSAAAYQSFDLELRFCRRRTYWHRIAQNLCYQYFRRRRRDAIISRLDDLLPEDDALREDDRSSWMASGKDDIKRVEQQVYLEQVCSIIRTLPEARRQLFILLLEDYSEKEIAEKLEISPEAAKGRVHRARQLLKTRIEL